MGVNSVNSVTDADVVVAQSRLDVLRQDDPLWLTVWHANSYCQAAAPLITASNPYATAQWYTWDI